MIIGILISVFSTVVFFHTSVETVLGMAMGAGWDYLFNYLINNELVIKTSSCILPRYTEIYKKNCVNKYAGGQLYLKY